MRIPELRRNGYFKAIVLNADTLEDVCIGYFTSSMAPNISGLCAHLGTTPHALKKIFDASMSDNPLISEEAVHVLASTVMNIEAKIIEGGLLGDLNAHMTKFILSAFHDRNEKHVTEEKSDKTIRVLVESHQPVTIEELREFDRLELELERQSQLELTSLGKSTSRDEFSI